MKRTALGIFAGTVLILSLSDRVLASPELSAADIVAKNAAACGGLDAWRKIQTMVWIGHVENQNGSAPKLPFTLEMKRPNKSRFRIEVQKQIAVNLFSGTHGWKLRTTRDGQPQMQPYTSDDLQFAQGGPGIDGPLIDYKAKGIIITLEGSDNVEGRKAYRLQVRLPSGATQNVWVDAKTFLEIKYDREVKNAFGQSDRVSVHYGDYRTQDGMKIPFLIETTAGSARASDKMVIDRILINPPLEDQLFELPSAPARHTIAIAPRAQTGSPVSSAFPSPPVAGRR